MIENSQQVLSTLKKINYFSSAKHCDSYDFSTIYTSIPHDSLKQAMKYLIQEAYRVTDVFLVVRSNGKGVWSDVPSARQTLTEDKLITYVEYLIDNVYVNVGNKVSVWASLWALIVLHYWPICSCSFTSTGT